jgi:hypothetical protein
MFFLLSLILVIHSSFFLSFALYFRKRREWWKESNSHKLDDSIIRYVLSDYSYLIPTKMSGHIRILYHMNNMHSATCKSLHNREFQFGYLSLFYVHTSFIYNFLIIIISNKYSISPTHKTKTMSKNKNKEENKLR